MRWVEKAQAPLPQLVLEAYQNPHPALSHNKMWERVIQGAAHKTELKAETGCVIIGAAVFRLARVRGLSARANRERPQRELRSKSRCG